MKRTAQDWARLGVAIREARERKGWTQPQLAERAGVSARSLWDAEHGRVPSGRTPYTLGRIAVQLSWPAGTIEAILAGDTPPGDAAPRVDPPADTVMVPKDLFDDLVRIATYVADEPTATARRVLKELDDAGLRDPGAATLEA